MKTKIAIIDYGMGNLRSVSKAVELCGANANITTKADELKKYNALILPGVGAFAPAIKRIKENNFDIAIKEHLKEEKMLLGICLGFQLLFSLSYEGGVHKGLDVIKGNVRKFIPKRTEKLIIPHMGWNTLNISQTNKAAKQMYKGIDNQSFVYFVHSYYCQPTDKRLIATTTKYSTDFCSSVALDNIWGCQFHPEKSSETGLKILKNFISRCEAKKC